MIILDDSLKNIIIDRVVYKMNCMKFWLNTKFYIESNPRKYCERMNVCLLLAGTSGAADTIHQTFLSAHPRPCDRDWGKDCHAHGRENYKIDPKIPSVAEIYILVFCLTRNKYTNVYTHFSYIYCIQ